MENADLILRAAALVRPVRTKDGLFADVGCSLVSESGAVYDGVCAAAGSNVSCAERHAVGAMVTAWEYRVRKIVAVWKDEAGAVFVIAPCGNCRQLLRETHMDNLDAEVVLDRGKTVALRELLPYHDWWQRQDDL